MKFAGFVPNEMKRTEVRVASYEDKVICGTLVNPFYVEEVAFTGHFQLLQYLEALQDELEYPQRAMEPRSFSGGEKRFDAPELPPPSDRKTPLATFYISIFFRQNASWQGSICWVERNETAQFRSVLELMMLMDSALAS